MSVIVTAAAFILAVYGLTLLRAILERLHHIESRAEDFHDEAVAEVQRQVIERKRVQERDDDLSSDS